MPSARSKPPLEKVIQKQILDYLLAKGYFVWRQNQGGIPTGKGGFRRFNGLPGLPDICGLLGGPPMAGLNIPDMGPYYAFRDGWPRFLGIEVKRPGGKLRPEQAAFIEKATALGHLAFMATSVADVKARGL